jgi:hypothetical protein
MNVNDNSMDIGRFKGPISPCPLCSSLSDTAKLDALTNGKACSLCMGQKFISYCKNCGGTGQYHGRTIWDGGRNEHTSTCTPCGGKGVYPARKPIDWDQSKWDTETACRNSTVCACSHTFGEHNNQRRDADNLSLWTAGQCRTKIGIAMCPCEEFRMSVTPAKVVENEAITV